MTRALTSTGVAAFLVLVAAVPAPAQPIPPEGPAINPSIYQVPADAKTITVDCDARQTLAAALADRSSADLNIVFSGTCKEYIYLQRDGVAIRGKDSTAAILGGIEITAARRVLLENFTCRDNTQLEYCIGALYGASVTLHNIKVLNSSVRGVLIYNAVALIDGLTVDKTISTSILIRGSAVRLEGELTFGHTVEGCLVIDNVASVFSKSGVFTARDCAAGVLLQGNSNFHAPFATFTLNHNSFAGLMLLTQGTFSYGGTIVARNNTQAGIFVDDGSSFSPFTNIVGSSALTLENNGRAGVFVRASYAELANVSANSGSTYGVFVEDGRLKISRSTIAENSKADVRLEFGAHAAFFDGTNVGTVSCDGTQLLRGAAKPCIMDANPTTTPKPTATPRGAGQPPKR